MVMLGLRQDKRLGLVKNDADKRDKWRNFDNWKFSAVMSLVVSLYGFFLVTLNVNDDNDGYAPVTWMAESICTAPSPLVNTLANEAGVMGE